MSKFTEDDMQREYNRGLKDGLSRAAAMMALNANERFIANDDKTAFVFRSIHHALAKEAETLWKPK